MKEPGPLVRQLYNGVPVSPGYSIGPVGILRRDAKKISERSISEERVEAEIDLFEKAHARTLRELQIIRSQLSKHLSEHDARIFETHAQILQGPEISEGIPKMIRKELVSAETSAHRVMQEIVEIFESGEQSFKDKTMDIIDVASRLLSHLSEDDHSLLTPLLSENSILVAHTLTPSLLTSAAAEKILGLATDTGGPTSHVAILARSLQIPAVSSLKQASIAVQKGDIAILDGVDGLLIINPTKEELDIYTERLNRWNKRQEELKQTTRSFHPITSDGKHIPLLANIELPEESKNALELGSEGVGLFRSEFLFFRKSMPSEEEQFEAYRQVLEQFHPHPVTIRTLDAGGDKVLKNFSLTDESNPELGWRSIRFCLDNKDIFQEQLRALLRASVYGKLKIMFPMISSLEELLQAKEVLEEMRVSLLRSGVRVADKIEIGTMIEVPAAVLQMHDLAKEVDFVSIGTNDLIQFTLAVDRSNEKVKDLFQPHHPAILQMINKVCQASHQEGVTVSCCGEMASDAISIILLTGLGVDELSMSPSRIVGNKSFLRSISYAEMKETAQECLKLKTSTEIDRLLYARFAKRVTDAGADSYLLSERRFQERALVKYGDNFVGLSFAEN